MWRYGMVDEIFTLLKNVYLLFPWFKGIQSFLVPKLSRDDLDFLIFYLVHQKMLEQLMESYTEPFRELRPILKQIESWLFILKLDVELDLKLGRSSSQATGEWMISLQKTLLSEELDFKKTVEEAQALNLTPANKDNSWADHFTPIKKSTFCFQMVPEEIDRFFDSAPHCNVLAHFFTHVVRSTFKNDVAPLGRFLKPSEVERLKWRLAHRDYDFVYGQDESQEKKFQAHLERLFTSPKYETTLSYAKDLLGSIGANRTFLERGRPL